MPRPKLENPTERIELRIPQELLSWVRLKSVELETNTVQQTIIKILEEAQSNEKEIKKSKGMLK